MLLVNRKRSSNLETNRAKNETREHQSKLAQKTSWAKNKLKLKFYQIILFSFPPFAGTGNVNFGYQNNNCHEKCKFLNDLCIRFLHLPNWID